MNASTVFFLDIRVARATARVELTYVLHVPVSAVAGDAVHHPAFHNILLNRSHELFPLIGVALDARLSEPL